MKWLAILLLPFLYVALDLFNFKVIAPSLYNAAYPQGIVGYIPAALVYVLYPMIVMFMTRKDRTAAERTATAAVLGASTYGIYHLTSAATVRGWNIPVAVYDTAWGAFVTIILALLASVTHT